MAQTFDIRFARSAGLAALLEAPENRFRWKGGGLLRIDAQSISFTVKRGLLALFAGKQTRRIPAEDLKAVYREGDALRVEFQTDETARMVLPFWADDREAAAQIVRLLPTSQTVEIEHTTGSSTPRADGRVMLLIGAALAALVAVAWVLYPRTELPVAAVTVPEIADAAIADATSPGAAEAVPSVPLPTSVDDFLIEKPAASSQSYIPELAIPDSVKQPPVLVEPPARLPLSPDRARSEDFVIRIERDTVAFHVAKTQLAAFEQDANQLEARWEALRDSFKASALTAEEFAAQLDDLEMRWWDVSFRLFDNEALKEPALFDLRATMLSAARLWRDFLSGYTSGLRERDHVKMGQAFDDLTRAQERRLRARLFLR